MLWTSSRTGPGFFELVEGGRCEVSATAEVMLGSCSAAVTAIAATPAASDFILNAYS
jgi:hypothetical protein